MNPPTPTSSIGFRRFAFGLCVSLLIGLGMTLLVQAMDWRTVNAIDMVLLALFVALFGQIAFGCVLSLFGFLQSLRENDPTDVMAGLPDGVDPKQPMAATAIILPVFNEEIDRVLKAVETMWEGLERTGTLEHFDFYILSDSNKPDSWIAEECAWLDCVRRLNGFGRIFYRKRKHALNRKSGNVADFCRRWGKRYRYMIVLDADSVMTGATMSRLVQAMERNPEVGLIQTVPRMVLGQSLFRRVLQFTLRVCGGIFSAGSHYWAGTAGSFWGHNAIIRLKPFMAHCALPELPEKDPSKRRVLSHDTVEAALMRRAGYGVCLAYREDGSYEEGPPNLTDMLKRDRRWCQGNLQHFWFLFARNIQFPSRLHIALGIMSYCSSLLWLAFLVLSAVSGYMHLHYDPRATGEAASAVPVPLVSLLGLTLVLLFLPKVLGYLAELPRAHAYGGALRMGASLLIETLLSVVFAPILMIFHSKFVLMTFLGLEVRWNAQNRSDVGLTWGDCARDYWWVTALGVATLAACAWWLPAYLPWMSFIAVPWMLSIPLVWFTSRPSYGMAAARAGLFITPDESNPPDELRGLEEPDAPQPELSAPALPGFARALLDPYTNAIHISLLHQRERDARETNPVDDSLGRLSLLGVAERSPGAIPLAEQIQLLWDGDSLQELHRLLWRCPGEMLHPDWRAAMSRLAADGDAVAS